MTASDDVTRVWILVGEERAGSYEINRLRETAEHMAIDVSVLDPRELDLIVNRAGENGVLRNGRPAQLPHCVIPRMGAGTTYFGLAAIRHFERLGLLVLNGSRSIQLARDKLATLQLLALSGIPIPKTMLSRLPFNAQTVEGEFSYPVILKPVVGSYGRGVFLCVNRSELEARLKQIESSERAKTHLILQEFIATSRGRDVRVLVVGGRAIGAMLRTAREGDFRANFSAGGHVAAFNLTHEVEQLAIVSAGTLGLDIAGVDILFGGQGCKVCEVNSAPGFRGFEAATGIDVCDEVYRCMRARLHGSFPHLSS